MKGTTENTCSQNTMSCMFSPPSLLATSCVQEVIGPYTLGVSCHGRSVQRSTGSNCPRNTSAGVISYGSRPIACSRPYAAYIKTSAEVIGGTQMVSRLSTEPSAKSFLGLGFQPSAIARRPTHSPRAPRMIADQTKIETNHSLGLITPAGRYQGGR